MWGGSLEFLSHFISLDYIPELSSYNMLSICSDTLSSSGGDCNFFIFWELGSDSIVLLASLEPVSFFPSLVFAVGGVDFIDGSLFYTPDTCDDEISALLISIT